MSKPAVRTTKRPRPKLYVKQRFDLALYEDKSAYSLAALIGVFAFLACLAFGTALALDHYARDIGGAKALAARTQANAKIITEWVARTPWVEFLCADASVRSPTSVCLKLAGTDMSEEDQAILCKKIAALLEKEGVAYDINAYRDAPPGFRIWCGATVESSDVAVLTQWLDWAYATCRAEAKAA